MIRGQAGSAVLLDTCAVIWLANGDSISSGAVSAIVSAGLADGIYVSPVSAWEVGLLSSRATVNKPAPQFLPDPRTWFATFMRGPGIKEAALTSAIAIDSSYLPGTLHSDPADRLIVATARNLNVPIVTRASRIITYAQAGHARVIPC
jgi:PIN domain nuclease of toxin-antitoxin system